MSIRILIPSILLVFSACTGGNGSDGNPSSTETTATTVAAGSTTDTAGSGSGTSADESTTRATGADGGSSSSSSSSSGSTTTGIEDDCEAMCAVRQMCVPDAGDCLETCTRDVEIFDHVGTCAAEFSALLQCIGGLDCEQYEAYGLQAGAYPCQQEYEALTALPVRCAMADLDPVCPVYCETATGCREWEGGLDGCLAECAVALATIEVDLGESCRDLYVSIFSCGSEATCMELEDPATCSVEIMEYEANCGS